MKIRLFGHPLHPMLVHFPTALFTSSLLFDLCGIYLSEPTFYTASYYCLGLGLLFGLLAAVFGFADYLSLSKGERVFQKATLHGGIQFLVITVFGVLFGIKFQEYPNIEAPAYPHLLASAIGVAAMIVGNYLGGDLVFRDGVGVSERSQ